MCDLVQPEQANTRGHSVRSSRLKGRFLSRSPRCFGLFGDTSIVTNWKYETSRQDLTRKLCFAAGPATYFIKLLDEGKIPYRKVGSYRRVKASDVLAYIKEYQQVATQAMRKLVAESQALGLYE